MPGDDRAFGIYQDRISEAELPDRGGDLLQLPLGMGPCIPRVGDQAADRTIETESRGEGVSLRVMG